MTLMPYIPSFGMSFLLAGYANQPHVKIPALQGVSVYTIILHADQKPILMFRAFTTATAVLTVTTVIAVAQPFAFMSKDRTNTVRMLNAETGESEKRITSLEAVHRPSDELGVPYLAAGGKNESDRRAIAELSRPEGVFEREDATHQANHENKQISLSDSGNSIISIVTAESGEILRRIKIPEAIQHTAVLQDSWFTELDASLGRRDFFLRLTHFQADCSRADSQYSKLRSLNVDKAPTEDEYHIEGEGHQIVAFRSRACI